MSRRNWIVIIVIAFFIGGIGGVVVNRYAIPYFATIPGLGWLQNLESSNPVVINRIQEIQYNEGANFLELSKQAAGYTVSIYSTAASPKYLANGVITSSDGMILSSKSNLPASGNVTVVLNDGTSHTGVIRALDPRSELVVITISASNLAVAPFGEAINLQASQRLIFLGRSNNAFTRDFALGQISRPVNNQPSLDRVYSSEVFENTLRTDAQITQEFVGGPIIDLNGRVVGMTTSTLGVLIGENLQSAVNSFFQSGKIQRPWFGIRYLNLSESLAKLRKVPQAGILVVSTEAGSPAQKAGILPNDLIVSIDNQDLPANNFEKVFNQHGILSIPLTVIRNNNRVNLTVNMEAR